MNLDISSLFPDLEALTPDGRWNMLQDWLAKHPEYGERAERWSTQTVDQVFIEICLLTTKRYGAFASHFLLLPTAQTKIRAAIEVLQACYRERAGQTETQLKAKKRRRKK